MKLIALLIIASLCNAIQPPELRVRVNNNNTITLKWSKNEVASRYRVFRSTHGSEYVLHKITNDTTYTFDIIENNADVGYFYVCSDSLPNMVSIPSGTFLMGSPVNQFNEPEISITLTHDFFIGATEVTNIEFIRAAQYALDNNYIYNDNGIIRDTIMNWPLLYTNASGSEITIDGSVFSLRQSPNAASWGLIDYNPANHPVKEVTNFGASFYCDWISLMEGLRPYYMSYLFDGPTNNNPYCSEGYRLPIEAEWERAASYPDNRIYPWGNQRPNCDLVNYNDYTYPALCEVWTKEVGSRPNGDSYLGLSDISGNVLEWMFSSYFWYSMPETINPIGNYPFGGSSCIRGGCWISPEENLQITTRWDRGVGDYSEFVGFRICAIAN